MDKANGKIFDILSKAQNSTVAIIKNIPKSNKKVSLLKDMAKIKSKT